MKYAFTAELFEGISNLDPIISFPAVAPEDFRPWASATRGDHPWELEGNILFCIRNTSADLRISSDPSNRF